MLSNWQPSGECVVILVASVGVALLGLGYLLGYVHASINWRNATTNTKPRAKDPIEQRWADS